VILTVKWIIFVKENSIIYNYNNDNKILYFFGLHERKEKKKEDKTKVN